MSEYPVLRLPELERPFILYTDCSGFALGAVLAQVDPEIGKEYVVCYASGILKDSERLYSIAEGEELATFYAINLWRVYLFRVRVR